MKVEIITDYLESLAPLEYQESYDNSGLLIGSKGMKVTGVLITLDCTEEVIDEAIENKCNLIISHHPVIFSGVKKINGSNYVERIIIKSIKNNLAIYSIHTNLDNIKEGVNSIIAKKFDLKNCQILSPKESLLRQLVVYCPKDYSANLINSLCANGAGKIGNYTDCSFSTLGKGTFKPKDQANPYKGRVGESHVEEEERIELIFPAYQQDLILKTMNKNHPYEEVAFQVYPLNNHNQFVGSGLIGELLDPVDSRSFMQSLKHVMNTSSIKHTNLVKEKIKKVAFCGGSGSFLIKKALVAGADIFITSDIKYHQFFEADKRIIIADIGHYESEQFTKDLLYDILTKKFTKFAFQLSKINTNPINYL